VKYKPGEKWKFENPPTRGRLFSSSPAAARQTHALKNWHNNAVFYQRSDVVVRCDDAIETEKHTPVWERSKKLLVILLAS